MVVSNDSAVSCFIFSPGHYLFVSTGSPKPQSAIWFSRELNSADVRCLTFWYSITSGSSGSLAVILWNSAESNRPEVWNTSSTSVDGGWDYAEANLSANTTISHFRVFCLHRAHSAMRNNFSNICQDKVLVLGNWDGVGHDSIQLVRQIFFCLKKHTNKQTKNFEASSDFIC